jgi:P27 family predicted phage terminase small subunit
MSNPPVPFALRALRGNPGKRPMKPEPQPEQLPDMPSPPPHIIGFARDEWQATGIELYRLGLLTKVDVAAFSCYCFSYGQWRAAAETLAKMQANDPITNGMMIKTKYGDAAANPLVAVVRKHAGDVVRYAGEFGLTALARSRISSGITSPRPPGKFDGLLGRRISE